MSAEDGTAANVTASLVGAIRGGLLSPGAVLDDDVLLLEHGVPPGAIPRVLDRLVALGLATRRRDRVVVVREPHFAEWVASVRMLTALIEGEIRSAVTRLTDDDVGELRVRGMRVLDLARARDPEHLAALRAFNRFWRERTPNLALRREVELADARFAFLSARPPDFRRWDLDAYVSTLLRAAEDRDVELACDAAHAFIDLVDAWTVDEAGRLGEDLDGAPTPAPGLPPSGLADDDVFWTLLGWIRDGTFPVGTTLLRDDLVGRTGRPSSEVSTAIDRIATIGLVEIVNDRRADVRRPTPDEWADAVRMSVIVHEACVRWALPVLSDPDIAQFRALVTHVLRRGRTRDLGYTESYVAVPRFFAERTPVPDLLRLSRTTITRLAFMLTPTPPFEEWDVGDYLSTLVRAVEERDTDLAIEAVHLLVPHNERHIERVLAVHRSDDD